jgi:hypothetical protein
MNMSSVGVPVAKENEGRRRPITNRLTGLAQAVEGSRRSRSFDVRQVLLATGASSMGLGLVAIVLGWYGAAHSAYQFQEIPYLISGGLLGVALVAGGGFLFFSSWLVRMIEDNHRHATRLESTLRRVDHVLGAVTEDAERAAQKETAAAVADADSRAQEAETPMGTYREGISDPGSPEYRPRHPGEQRRRAEGPEAEGPKRDGRGNDGFGGDGR